jgi:hypothetical protein
MGTWRARISGIKYKDLEIQVGEELKKMREVFPEAQLWL